MENDEAEEGRDTCTGLMRQELELEEELRQMGQWGPSLWQEAEQKGSYEAVGLQESCLGS